jgi:hypothetical protein
MRNNIGIDLLLNVVFPILLGGLTYLTGSQINEPVLIKNHLADGLWAYSFISALLIIWGREINRTWIFIPFAVAVLFELLQGSHLVPGTGDLYDVLTYCIFFTIALLANKYFKTRFSFIN